MFEAKKPPTLEDLEAAVSAQTEVLRRVLTMQVTNGELLSSILAAVTRQPEQEESDLGAVLRALFALSSEHADRLREVVAVLRAERK